MKLINWNPEKNQLLLEERGVSFEDIVVCIQQGEFLDIIEHPNKEKYTDEEIFLKAIIPSRKATKTYLGDK